MSKIAISGYYGFDNFGDETILFVLLQNLKKFGHNVTVFSKNPEITAKKYNVKSVQTFSLFQILKTLLFTDVLISGGGSLLQDATSVKSLIYYLFVIFVAALFNKKIIIFAQGIGPINNKFLNFLTKKLLQGAEYISVRDEKSLFLLRSWGLNPVLVNDPVWGLKPITAKQQDFVGIQLRDWKNLSDEFLMKLAEKISQMPPDTKIKLLAFQNMADLPVCGKFRNYILQYNPLMSVCIIKNESIEQLVYELSTCYELVAMRYHALLLGLKLGIKSFALCYDIKVQTLAEENNVPFCLINDVKTLQDRFCEIETQAVEPINKDFSFDDMNSIL